MTFHEVTCCNSTVKTQGSVTHDWRVPEERPKPQGTLGRQTPGLGTRGQVVLSLGEEGPWRPRLRRGGAGPRRAPAGTMESWPRLERTSGVYKNVPPGGASGSRDSKRISFFSLFATLKNKPFFLF